MQQGAAVVPVLCLGEIGCLHNACNWPAMQQWSYKNLGFPIPYLVVGRWGVTPFPRRTGLKFVVGQPIRAESTPTDGQVILSLPLGFLGHAASVSILSIPGGRCRGKLFQK